MPRARGGQVTSRAAGLLPLTVGLPERVRKVLAGANAAIPVVAPSRAGGTHSAQGATTTRANKEMARGNNHARKQGLCRAKGPSEGPPDGTVQ